MKEEQKVFYVDQLSEQALTEDEYRAVLAWLEVYGDTISPNMRSGLKKMLHNEKQRKSGFSYVSAGNTLKPRKYHKKKRTRNHCEYAPKGWGRNVPVSRGLKPIIIEFNKGDKKNEI